MPTTTKILLDTSLNADAWACGYETAEVEGLKVTAEALADIGPCVSLSKYGAEVELTGAAEINELIRALVRAVAIADRAAVVSMKAA